MMPGSDPFAHFGITHLSPSSLKLYREDPAAWVMRYLFRIKGEVGPGAWRGKAVEAGVDRVLWGATKEEALKATCLAWDNEAQGVIDEKAAKEYETLEDYLDQAILAFKGRGIPLMRQRALSYQMAGMEVPIIGYADYVWHGGAITGCGVDLKTTKKMPSAPHPEHVEQVALYERCTEVPFSLVYVTPKRHETYLVDPEMSADAMHRLERGARAVRSMLMRCDTPQDALLMFSPDMASWNWDVPMIEAANKIYNGGTL